MDINFIDLAEVDSTNLYARRQSKHFEREKFYLISAAYQSQGKGRFDRSWLSTKGKNLLLSFFWRTNAFPALANVAQVLALATVFTLDKEGLCLEIKWPNDLMYGAKKMGGILVESWMEEADLCLVIGLGLNVNADKEDLAKIPREVSSLSILANKAFELKKLKEKLAGNFLPMLLELSREGFSSFAPFFLQRCQNLGKHLSCQTRDRKYEGLFKGINAKGVLCLELTDGKLIYLPSAEVL